MVLLLLLLLDFEELVPIFLLSFLTAHLPLQGRTEFSNPAVQDLFLIFDLVAAITYGTYSSFGMIVEHPCANGLLEWRLFWFF